MLKKIYIEITNVCNLNCAFCPGTRRAPRFMRLEEFARILDRLSDTGAYLYLHLMGEPLLHPELPAILAEAARRERKICITTNGTLLGEREDTLLQAKALYKISVSLHSLEGNGNSAQDSAAYLSEAWSFAERAAARGIIVALRLWNEGGAAAENPAILRFLSEKTGTGNWPEPRRGSYRLKENLYLERERAFDWPEDAAPERPVRFCRALRDQIGILADGTVVPCCLDHEGQLALGNLFTESLESILSSRRARSIFDGFSRRRPAEDLCRRCGYAQRFNK